MADHHPKRSKEEIIRDTIQALGDDSKIIGGLAKQAKNKEEESAINSLVAHRSWLIIELSGLINGQYAGSIYLDPRNKTSLQTQQFSNGQNSAVESMRPTARVYPLPDIGAKPHKQG